MPNRNFRLVAGEQLVGDIDGENTMFELQHEPAPESVALFKNGRMLRPQLAYKLRGRYVVFNEPPAPGDVLLANYVEDLLYTA